LLIICTIRIFRQRKPIKIIAIEGNIGAGKTTLIDYLKSCNDIIDDSVFISEPVDEWMKICDDSGENILTKFYKDKHRWAFLFQKLVYDTRLKNILDSMRTTNKRFMFLDRSLGTDKNIFEKMLFDDGFISKLEHEIYNLSNTIYEKCICNDTKKYIIYLRCEPEVAFNRIHKRARGGEESITLEYLEKLHKNHEDWITDEIHNNNVLILDYNGEMDKQYLHDTIKRFMYRS
jgi:deoxyadenosine/deoxycytidine kinase